MPKVALITGITGQDGSFLAEFLLEKGYEVHGIIRRSSSFNTGRIEHLYLDEWVRDIKNKRLLTLHYRDMARLATLPRQAEWEAYVSQIQVRAADASSAER